MADDQADDGDAELGKEEEDGHGVPDEHLSESESVVARAVRSGLVLLENVGRREGEKKKARRTHLLTVTMTNPASTDPTHERERERVNGSASERRKGRRGEQLAPGRPKRGTKEQQEKLAVEEDCRSL